MTRTPRGGVLLDLFLIAALLAGGGAAWVAWQKGSLPAIVKNVVAAAPVSLGGKEPEGEPDLDVSDRSAWIQGEVRELLARFGADDKHVLKTYNAERREDGIQWLEDTLVVRRPAGFVETDFLKSLAPLLAERRLVLMEDRREGAKRTLEVGDRKRVYQRIIFDGSSPRRAKR